MLVTIIIVLILVGVGLYLVQLIPMDPTVKRIVHVLIILFAVLWVLDALGLFSHLSRLR